MNYRMHGATIKIKEIFQNGCCIDKWTKIQLRCVIRIRWLGGVNINEICSKL